MEGKPVQNANERDISEIFHLGPQLTASKVYPVVGPKISIRQMLEVLESITSKRAIAAPSTIEQWGARVSEKAGPGYRQDIEQMMEWINIAPDDKICFGTLGQENDHSLSDLGVRASSFQEWIERYNWQGP